MRPVFVLVSAMKTVFRLLVEAGLAGITGIFSVLPELVYRQRLATLTAAFKAFSGFSSDWVGDGERLWEHE